MQNTSQADRTLGHNRALSDAKPRWITARSPSDLRGDVDATAPFMPCRAQNRDNRRVTDSMTASGRPG